MDPLVKKAQEWVNKTYTGKDGYIPLEDKDIDGIAGWKTVYALLRALQIELGITETSTNFGPTTTSRFNERFPNGIQVQSEDDKTKSNIYRIVECGLWVKGYSTGSTELSGYFKSGQGNAIKNLKEDAGCKNTDSTVTLNIMKALMSMVQFRILGIPPEKIYNIRKIQQKLNYNYEDQIGLSPCDGVYGRDMNTALIKALQVIEGSTGKDVDGLFGDGTKSKLPILPDNAGRLTEENRKRAVSLLSWCLYCNGYTDANIDQEIWDSNLYNLVLQFQADNLLSQDGIAGADVWMGVLLSTGNPSRSANACDSRFDLYSEDAISYLKSQNYVAIGRYLTGGNYKQLRKEEPQVLINNGIGIFLIFQEGESKDYFTSTNGKYDAESSINAAKKYGIPNGNIIYYAVDFDATDEDIDSCLIPYFSKLKETMQSYGNPFKIGIYGTRNVCQRIIDKGYAESAYLSSLSTGFSGNLGFKKPASWNLDQFAGYSTVISGENVDFDKVSYRGLVEPVKSLESPSSNGHAYLRPKMDQYYLGTAKNIDRNGSTGVYFTPLCSKLKIQGLFKMVTVPEDEGIGNFRLVVYLQQYNSNDSNKPIEIKDKFLYLTDGIINEGVEFDVIPGVDYKLRYELRDVGSTEIQTSLATCNVDIYITTFD